MTVEVQWSALYKDEPGIEPFLPDHSTILPGWAGDAPNGQSAAQMICEDFFNDAMWAEHCGTEDTCITIYLDIHMPPSIASRYRVELERRTKATAQRMIPVMRATG